MQKKFTKTKSDSLKKFSDVGLKYFFKTAQKMTFKSQNCSILVVISDNI